jgi:hypothetical protein
VILEVWEMSTDPDRPRQILAEHEQLEEEWERLDNMGSQDVQAQKIAARMERLREEYRTLTGKEFPADSVAPVIGTRRAGTRGAIWSATASASPPSAS